MTDTLTPAPAPAQTPPIASAAQQPPAGPPPVAAPPAQKSSKTWMILFAVIALVVGLGIGYFVANSKTNDMKSQRDDAQAQVTQFSGEVDTLESTVSDLESTVSGLESDIAALNADKTQLESDLAAAQEATGVAVGAQEICTKAATDASALVDSYQNYVGDWLTLFNGVLEGTITQAEADAAIAHLDEQSAAQSTAHDTVHTELAQCNVALGG